MYNETRLDNMTHDVYETRLDNFHIYHERKSNNLTIYHISYIINHVYYETMSTATAQGKSRNILQQANAKP